MWGDQAKWVVCREYWFWEITNYSMNFLCILLFSAEQNCVYLWKNYKSDSDGVFSKTKLLECFHKWITKLKFDSAWHKTHLAWLHHIYALSEAWLIRLLTTCQFYMYNNTLSNKYFCLLLCVPFWVVVVNFF